ncbi:MAG TPA: BACON domain-containing carbohydrate-binding protein [Vicinamibacterales bacterium]|nr:BACON domain-containing carbohydrate-binding protein [Vicinamibacterales bacterium]
MTEAGRRWSAAPVLVAIATAMVAAACGSTSTTSVGPSPVKCEVSLAGPPQVAAGAGTGTITVTTQPECAWTASTDAPWISGLTPRSGQGSGKFSFSVAANPVPSGREGDIIVNDTRVLVRQDFSPCTFNVGPSAVTVPAAGASRAITVSTVGGCTWTSTSGATWLTITGGNGNGNGNVTVQAAANPGPARTGSVVVAGETIVVSQSASGAGSCSYSISPTSIPAPASGGPFSLGVTSSPGCAWSATSDVPWMSITAGAAGNGNGTVAYTVATNTTTSARTGHVNVEGQALTVNQSAGSVACDYSINPTQLNSVPAAGGTAATTVSVATGCVWTAVSNASWLTVTSGTTGNGNGSVNITVAANDTPARQGTVTVAGRTFTVSQSGGCTFSLQPTSLTIDPDGGPSSTAVTTGPGCSWTASVPSQFTWLRITSGTPGSGNGTVAFTVDRNTGPPRNGTLTVAGQTFTVNQVNGCAFSISPTSQNFSAAGGNGTTTVTAGASCAWTATSNAPWIMITSGSSGSGNGPVTFTVGGNSGPARSGTLTVADKTYTVDQATGCTYTITPTSQSIGSGGGQVNTLVTTSDGCAWDTTISPQASWLTLSSSGSGSSDATVTFNVASNNGPQRSGTATVAGQTFTVIQSIGCTVTISSQPSPLTFSASAGSGSATVTAGAGCPWTATATSTSGPPFVTITSPSGGNGSGTSQVNYSVSANTGLARTATLTIAGQNFSITQASGCTVTITSPPSPLSFTSAGGSGSATVTASAPACTWTATSTQSFLTISAPAGGNGSGTGVVTYSVSANTGTPRTATLTILGQAFTVTQATGCNPQVSTAPSPLAFSQAGGTGTAAVTAGTGCTWPATSNQPFLTISAPAGGNGNGSGAVNYSVAANTGPAQRTATLTIAGQAFTVTQGGCTYTINPPSQSFGVAGGIGSVTVTTAAGCTWTAAVNGAPPPTWISITSGSNSTGPGTVTFTVQPNLLTSRSATLTIAGQTFTVNQN